MDANINKGGRPKKNKKGAGRPSGAYSKLHPGDKAVYHQNKTRVSRGYSPSRSSGRDDSYPRRLNRGRSGEYRREEGDEEVQVKKRGRPQLNPEKGSMDDEALKERKRELWKLDYKKKKIEYQPSGAGGTRSPPATPHHLQHLSARLIQNGQLTRTQHSN